MKPDNPFRDILARDRYGGTWVPVARAGGSLDDVAILPALAERGNVDVLLSDQDWPFDFDAARPAVWETGDDDRVEAELHPENEHHGVKIWPLVVRIRPADGPQWLEPIQAFVLHTESAPRRGENGAITWEASDGDGRPEPVARWSPTGRRPGQGTLEVRRDVLFDFMRDFGFDLALFEEHNLEVEGVPDGWRDNGCGDAIADRCWRCWAADVWSSVRGMLASSR
jgi:hypothetical protein